VPTPDLRGEQAENVFTCLAACCRGESHADEATDAINQVHLSALRDLPVAGAQCLQEGDLMENRMTMVSLDGVGEYRIVQKGWLGRRYQVLLYNHTQDWVWQATFRYKGDAIRWANSELKRCYVPGDEIRSQ
jgi:hypothetical protein